MAESSELGAFLRARRARVRPADVGLPPGIGVRRTPGLRREELAALAGVSIDYYRRLEQGVERNPSTAVLDALARALLLDEDAHVYLYSLADRAAERTPPRVGSARRAVRPEVEQLLDALRPRPAYVLGPASDMLCANPEALQLFVGLADWPPARRNTIRYVFLHPNAHDLFVDWHEAASSGVANLRAAQDTAEAAALVEELTAESRDFARLWDRYDVAPRRGGPKAFNHPDTGPIKLIHEVLVLADDRQRLAVYQVPRGSADGDALSLLSLAAQAAGPK